MVKNEIAGPISAEEEEPVEDKPDLQPGSLLRWKNQDQSADYPEKVKYFLIVSPLVWKPCPHGSVSSGWEFAMWDLETNTATKGLWSHAYHGYTWEIIQS